MFLLIRENTITWRKLKNCKNLLLEKVKKDTKHEAKKEEYMGKHEKENDDAIAHNLKQSYN